MNPQVFQVLAWLQAMVDFGYIQVNRPLDVPALAELDHLLTHDENTIKPGTIGFIPMPHTQDFNTIQTPRKVGFK